MALKMTFPAGALAIGAAVLLAAAPARADDLSTLSSVLSSYSLFLGDNLGSSTTSYTNTDTYLPLVVGGNAYIGSLTNSGGIGINTSGSATLGSASPYGLVVGNTLYFNGNGSVNGSVYAGTATVINLQSAGVSITGNLISPSVSVTGSSGGSIGGNLVLGNSAVPTGITINGTTTTNATLSSPLSVGYSTLSAAATTLSGLVGSTGTSPYTNAYSFTGTNTSLDVFKLSAAQASSFSISSLIFNVPTTATVVLDIIGDGSANSGAGTAFTLTNGSMSGASASKVLLNFEDTSTITLTNYGVVGSILAPSATIIGNSGNISGAVVASSFIGNTELEAGKFTGSLSAVPLPAALPLLGVALAGLGGFGMRKARRRDKAVA